MVSEVSISSGTISNRHSIWALFPITTAILALTLAFAMPTSYGIDKTGQTVAEAAPQPGL